MHEEAKASHAHLQALFAQLDAAWALNMGQVDYPDARKLAAVIDGVKEACYKQLERANVARNLLSCIPFGTHYAVFAESKKVFEIRWGPDGENEFLVEAKPFAA